MHVIVLYGFLVQIYYDFSGYSDIAIGSAFFGFDLPENFKLPFRALSVREFWRRWHITLSSWLQDYVYFPLGGSRRAEPRVLFNLMVTMILIGLWHGASWPWALFGTIQGIAMCLERTVERAWGRPFATSPLRRFLLWVWMSQFIAITYICVRAEDMSELFGMLLQFGARQGLRRHQPLRLDLSDRRPRPALHARGVLSLGTPGLPPHADGPRRGHRRGRRGARGLPAPRRAAVHLLPVLSGRGARPCAHGLRGGTGMSSRASRATFPSSGAGDATTLWVASPMTNDQSTLFSFGLWTVGNPDATPASHAVRPVQDPCRIVQKLGEIGYEGEHSHDEDLVPFGSSAAERDRIVADFKKAMADSGVTCSHGDDEPVLPADLQGRRLPSNDPRVRAFALRKTMDAIDLGVELGAKTYVFWGGREGTRPTHAATPGRASSLP